MPAPPAPPEPLHTSLPSCCQTHCVMTAAAAGPHIRQHMKDAVGRPQSHNSDDPSLEPSSPRSPGRVGGGGGQVFAVLCLSLCCTRIPHILKYQWPVSYHSQMKVQHGAAGIQVPHPTPIIMLSATHLSAHTSSTGVRVSLDGSHTTTLPLACPVTRCMSGRPVDPLRMWPATAAAAASRVQRLALLSRLLSRLTLQRHTKCNHMQVMPTTFAHKSAHPAHSHDPITPPVTHTHEPHTPTVSIHLMRCWRC